MKGSPLVTRVGDEVVVSVTADLDFPTLCSTLERMLAGDPTLRDCPALVLDTGRLQLTADQVMAIEGLVSRYGGTRLLHVITEQVDETRSRHPVRDRFNGFAWPAGAGRPGPDGHCHGRREPVPEACLEQAPDAPRPGAPPAFPATVPRPVDPAPAGEGNRAGAAGEAVRAARVRRRGRQGGPPDGPGGGDHRPQAPRGRPGTPREQGSEERPGARGAATGSPGSAGGAPGIAVTAWGETDPRWRQPAAAPPAGAGSSRGAGRARAGVVVRRTLRSGHRLVYDGDVVILGDVNPGAEVLAAGDVVVFGRLRGTVHAGFKGDEQAVVAALVMEPVQLRIARWIGRAPDGEPPPGAAGRAVAGPAGGRSPEIACVRDGQVLIEPFDPARWFWQRQRERAAERDDRDRAQAAHP
ncbi:septum formation inhibitor MinC [Thermaerobacter sp. PB12/4term]|uniref:septum site-determining protein MinC n=1 Tax=Thermaerobacter sp. PB12/4term TaxID=2293838 RepID=UPI000E329933|nr:septum site-determining protein MinC [Thermaerobacter sp. PB12/4term]QIA27974.1 septum formation inhibitor MinC [Thermaerobacter sp. PB12/4term]